MSRPNRVVAEVICAAVAAIVIGGAAGCEDAAAARRADVQQVLEEASGSLRHATVTAVNAGDEEFAKVEEALSQIDRDLSKIREAEPGQQAAAAILSAAALRELGAMRLGRAAEIESDNHRMRAVLRAKIDVVQRLSAIAAGHEQLNTAAPRQWIEVDREAAAQRLDDLRQDIAELSGPIGERTSENSARAIEAERLLREANDLYRRAAELGHSPGLESFEEAVAKRREAEKIQYGIDQNEIDLDFDLEPEHRLHETRARHLSALIDSLETARNSLEQHVEDLEAALGGTQDAAAQLTQEIEAARRTLDERLTNELDLLYSQSNENLERAASLAERAARGPAASASRLAAARVYELQGRLHWMRAQGLADHARLLHRLNGVSGAAALEREIESARSAFDEAIEQAKTVYGKAVESLAQVQGRGARQEIDTLRVTLEEAVASLSGKPLEAAPAAVPDERQPAARDERQPSSAHQAALGAGAASPEELVATLNRLAGETEPDAADFAAAFDYLYFEFGSAAEREVFEIFRDMMMAAMELDSALQAALGVSLSDLEDAPAAGGQTPGFPGMPGPGMGAMGMGMGDGLDLPTSITLGPVSGDRGQAILTMEDGSTETVELLAINDRWYMQLPEDVLGEEMGGGAGEGETEMMVEMMRAMFGGFTTAMNRAAERVRGGEFASADEFKAAFDAEMQQAMQGMFGGMMGGPPGQMPPGMGAPNR
ncbi:MAG: hypothetical protein ACYSXF_03410 [Planctomycetota bacterium]|jgi:hypothetical protein